MVNLILIGVLALGTVTLVSGVVKKYNSAVEGRITAEAELKKCGEKYTVVLGQVGNQNKAIASIVKERDKAQVIARSALALAAKEADRNKPERDRLAMLEKTFKSTSACPAGDAVKKVREGLRP